MILKPMLIRIFGNVLKNIVLPILFSFVVAYLYCTEKFTSVVLLNKFYIRTDLAHLGPEKTKSFTFVSENVKGTDFYC